MAGKPKKRTISKAEMKSARRLAASAPLEVTPEEVTSAAAGPKKKIAVPRVVVVRDLAERLNLPVGKIMGELMKNGIMATLNDSIDFETAAIICDELGFELIPEADWKVAEPVMPDRNAPRLPRPPVVTVMGHVDHGKTKLLDAIRQTDVVSAESGGITQHIGAYQVEIAPKSLSEAKSQRPKGESSKRLVTFLDTPGHEAFAALRAHGAGVTDIVILVVAANEGVRPQTIEALSHARAAGVPIIVALTKIDLPDPNLDRVKKELADLNLIPEEWGGQTIFVPVSAKTGEGIDHLLEMILLVADMAELKSVVEGPALGVVIDASLRPGLGPLATLLVQEGTLRVGDPLTVGATFGKVRIMTDWRGKRLTEALPSTPVVVAGLNAVPRFGDRFRVVADEKTARALVATKSAVRRTLSLSRLSESIKEGKTKELPILIKADVPGSLAAIQSSLENLSTTEVVVKLVSAGVGPVSDSDINLASASGALVLAFRVPILPSAKRLAESQGVEVSSYDIIYQLIDEVAVALSGLLAPEIVEVELGRLTVLKVFKSDKRSSIIGGRVISGVMTRDAFARVIRNGRSIGEGKIISLQRGKDNVSEVAKDFECGLGVEGITGVGVGDEIVAFRTEERKRKIEAASRKS